MRASFSSRDVDNHTAFIRIKTNAPNEDQFIILPVEVEVTSGVLLNLCATVLFNHYSLLTLMFHSLFAAPGIYSSTEMLDFGTLRSQGLLSLKKRHLSVFSFSNQPPDSSLWSLPPTSSCCRSSKAAESTPFKFRDKRCSHYGAYPKQNKAWTQQVSQGCKNPWLYSCCFSECTYNTVKWSRHNRLQSSYTQSWREQIYQSRKY